METDPERSGTGKGNRLDMRDYYLTFLDDKVDKMQIFNALADAGLKDFVLTEQFNATSEKNCYSCEYGRKAAYCSYDDAYCDEADTNGECACWRASTVAENAQVDHFRETTKKIELMEE